MHYCHDCEVWHAEGACERVQELRQTYYAIQPEQLMLALGAACEWHANHCPERATHRVVTYVATTVLVIEDRLLCDEHTQITFMAGNQEADGFRAESIRLPDPTDPKVLNQAGYTEEAQR